MRRPHTDILPRLRNGCAWLDANWEGIRPLAVTIAPTDARLLGRLVQALREDPPP